MYADKIHAVDTDSHDQSSNFSLVDDESSKYNRIEIKQFEQVFGILCA
jgi:hypothetical protein